MGQYIAIGLVTKCVTAKNNLTKSNILFDELIVEMGKQLFFDASLFEITETDDNYLFHLKSSIFEEQLLPFLKNFYPKVYMNKPNYCNGTIDKLTQTTPSEWMALAEDKYSEEFQIDDYGTNDYIYLENPSRDRISISYTSIILSMEGKIGMEQYGRQFNFFKYCMQQTYSEFSLAKALRVYITG